MQKIEIDHFQLFHNQRKMLAYILSENGLI